MHILNSLIGMALILAIAFALSAERRAIRLRVVGAAFALQAGFAALVLYSTPGREALKGVSDGVAALLGYAHAGVDFLFGPLADPKIGGHSFAIAALPVIVFFAALISILYYLGVMQLVIRWIGGALEKITGISRVESLCAASNIFVGQSEAPLVIRPYLAAMTPSQLFCMMSVGMAGVAGTILAAYASMGIRIDYLVAAAFMSAPGGICMAKIIMPDPPGAIAEPDADADTAAPGEPKPANLIMAASEGAQTGVRLAVAVGAMVLAFVALVALANGLFGAVGGWFGYPQLSFQQVLGYGFASVFRLLGAPDWAQAMHAGGLFGTKLVLNEFVAFKSLADKTVPIVSEKGLLIVSVAICGFANFSSVGMQIGGIGELAPGRRADLARLGLKALLCGTLASYLSATIAGILM